MARSNVQSRSTHKAVKAIVLVFLTVLAIAGLKVFSSVVTEGWLPAFSLLVALGLVTIALIEAART